MTAIKFRAHRLSKHEVITPGALENLVGQVATFTAPNRVGVATVTAAEVSDGWLVLTTDLDTETMEQIDLQSLLGIPEQTGYSIAPGSDSEKVSEILRRGREHGPSFDQTKTRLVSLSPPPDPTRQ